MLFALKKLVAGLLMPVSLLILCLFIAYFFRQKGKQQIAGAITVVAVFGVYFLSTVPGSQLLAVPLEFKHVSYDGQPVDYVVVLGGGHDTDSRVPDTSVLNQFSYVRLSEGVAVYKQNPGAKLLLSGYSGVDPRSHADVAAKTALTLGVADYDILLNPDAKDTGEEAQGWRERLAGQRFALVTSAMHMPRAVRLFEEAGLGEGLVTAPTNYLASGLRVQHWRDWLPKAYNLQVSEAAWHEYLGIAWISLSKYLSSASD